MGIYEPHGLQMLTQALELAVVPGAAQDFGMNDPH
jgi:hypothetical protein